MNNGPAMASSQTTTITETHVQTNIRWDPNYIKTIPGGLKLAGIVSLSFDQVFLFSSFPLFFFAISKLERFFTDKSSFYQCQNQGKKHRSALGYLPLLSFLN